MKKTGKKALSLLVCTLLLLTMLPRLRLTAEAGETGTTVASGSCGQNVNWTITATGTLRITGTGAMNNYTTYTDAPWYSNWETIKSVEVCSGVTSVGDWAFVPCNYLVTATLADSVTRIGNNAFRGCQKLVSVEVPDSVTQIGACAFYDCRGLTSVQIPKGVTTIHPGTFSLCMSLTSVTIPDGVVEILGQGIYGGKQERSGAFSYCHSLTSVTIPDSVTTIGYMAFYYCGDLTSITIPGSVTDVGSYAFGYYEEGLAINFLGSAPTFADTTFDDSIIELHYPCSDKTWTNTVTSNYGGNVTWIKKHTMDDDAVFQAATCTEDATLTGTCTGCGFEGTAILFDTAQGHNDPDGVCTVCGLVKIIHNGKCGENLRWQLNVQGTLTISGTGPMDDECFMEGGGYSTPWWWEGCEELITHIVIENGVTSLGEMAFYHCRNLISVSIPESVTSIGKLAFSGCSNLRYVIVPGSVTSIGGGAFGNCTGLTSVAFLGSAPTIDSTSFYKTGTTVYHPCNDPTWTDAVKQNYGGTITWDGHLYRDFVPNQAATCTENAVVTGTCGNCGATAQVSLPGTIIGHDLGEDGMCRSCAEELEFIICMKKTGDDVFREVDACIEVYADGVLLEKACLDEFVYTTQTTIPYTPGKTYTFVRKGSDNCLFDIILNENILVSGSSNLYSEGETIDTLENLHFHQYEAVVTPPTCSTTGSVTHTCAICGNSHSVDIPIIDHRYVNGVCKLCYGGGIPASGSCGTDVRWYLDKEGNLTISGTGTMKNYTIPQEGGEPNTPWYRYRQLITKVVIESGVTTIGEYAFHGCQNLTDVTIPGSVTTIGKLAFYNGIGLRSMTIPKGVTTIGSAAFRRCSNLTNVILPEGLTTIGKIAFYDCSGLGAVTIPGSVTSIGEYAFGNCTGLAAVTFPGAAPSMDSTCFKNVNATAIYPCNNNTWIDLVKQNYGGTIIWEAGHRFGDYIPDGNATCTEDATTTSTCSFCGKTETMVLPGTATGHTRITVPGYGATCTEDGLTDAVICALCHGLLTAHQTIPATGHDYRITEFPGSCVGYGYDLHQCQNCGDIFYKNLTFPTGHRYENGVCTLCGDGSAAILPGDVNGDGERNIIDVSRLYAHNMESTLLDSDTLPYADVNGDGSVDIADTARLYAHVKGTYPLT